MKKIIKLAVTLSLIQIMLTACVTQLYKPGTEQNSLNQIKLGQTYGEMVNILGEPDHSRTEDRTAIETLLLFMPIWGFVELIADYNPSMMQVYNYDQWGTVTVDNNNHVIRVEAK